MNFTRDQVDLIASSLMPDADSSEVALFVEVCKAKNLDPFSRQIYPQRRWNNDRGRYEYSFLVGIDGFRLIAERTGNYEGQDGPYWCGKDGQWRDVWTDDTPPVAAKVGIYKRGFRAPLYSVAKYAEYVQVKKDGKPNAMWAKMPANQIAKCAEAICLRRAFPDALGGLYTPDEMDQADNPAVDTSVRPAGTGQNLVTPRMAAPLPEEPPADENVPLPEESPQTYESETETLRLDIAKALGISTDSKTLRSLQSKLALAYRGFCGLQPNEPVAAPDMEKFTTLLLSIKEGCQNGEITKEQLRDEAYSLGEVIAKLLNHAPEEPAKEDPPLDVEVTDEMLRARWKMPTVSAAEWSARITKSDATAHNPAELAAFRRLAYHTLQMSRAANSGKSWAEIVSIIEERIGRPLVPDTAISKDVELELSKLVGELKTR